MKSQKNKHRLFLLMTGILLIVGLLYFFQVFEHRASTDINLILRRIETPYKAWLNGYLGFFFNVKFVGILNWMVIPLGIFYLRKKSLVLNAPLKATLLAICFTILLIGIKGFFNSRYQLTLYPAASIIIIFLLFEVIRDYFFEYLVFIITFFSCLLFFNNLMYGTLLRDKQLLAKKEISRKGYFSRLEKKISDFKTFSDTSQKFKECSNQISKALFFINYLDSSEAKTNNPYVIIDFIAKLNSEKKILVNNYPMLYYYTKKKGVYYWCGDDTYFGAYGVKPLLKGRSNKEITGFVFDSLDCGYVLSSEIYNAYNQKFNSWIQAYGKPVCYDPSDFILYEIQKTPGNFPIDTFPKVIEEHREKISKRFYINDSLKVITY